jgi:hypothetical protein
MSLVCFSAHNSAIVWRVHVQITLQSNEQFVCICRCACALIMQQFCGLFNYKLFYYFHVCSCTDYSKISRENIMQNLCSWAIRVQYLWFLGVQIMLQQYKLSYNICTNYSATYTSGALMYTFFISKSQIYSCPACHAHCVQFLVSVPMCKSSSMSLVCPCAVYSAISYMLMWQLRCTVSGSDVQTILRYL